MNVARTDHRWNAPQTGSGIPVLRAGFEGSGSPRWLMRTLQRGGFDHTNGFTLELVLLDESTHRHGTLAAVAEGRADVCDADWLALAAARRDGLPVTAVHPYGRILGTLVGHRDLTGDGLAALAGTRLGVLSRNDKNWRILRAAWARQSRVEFEDAVAVETYRGRDDLATALETGAVDAALLHWHLVPRVTGNGHRILAELPALADALGAAGAPTTFFVVHDDLASRQPERVASFLTATQAACACLRDSTAPWQALGDELGPAAADVPREPLLAALRTRWQERIAAAGHWSPPQRHGLEVLYATLHAPAMLPPGMLHPAFLP